MTLYTEFVKAQMAKMPKKLTQQEKIKKISQLWKARTGKAKKSKAEKGASIELAGGKIKNTKTGRAKKGKSIKMAGGKIKKTDNKTGRGVRKPIILDSGVMLHPSMLGGAWYDDLWRGFKLPFEVIGKVAESPFGQVAKLIL